MKLRDIYKLAVEQGIRHDPRGKKGVDNYLKKIRREYLSLSPQEKKTFDKEKLTNPFSDTRILYGGLGRNIKNVMVGIDIKTEELLLADALKRRGKRIDLALSHHPDGFALSRLYEVMNVQVDILKKAGVPYKKAKQLLDERMTEVMRKTLAGNAMRSVDAARLLEIPFMCAHTVADNFVSEYIGNAIRKARPRKVGDIIDIISQEPEYRYAISTNAGPRLILGKASNSCGKIAMEMTGGTEGPKKVFSELKKAGIKTIVGMHMSEEHLKKARKYSFNVLIAGHISSDNMGVNLLLDAVDKKGELRIIPCSGFKRVTRKR